MLGSNISFAMNDTIDGNVTFKLGGCNNYGELGLGNTKFQNTLATITSNNLKQIEFGYNYSMFLYRDGTVKACGYNGSGYDGNGQLGIGTTNSTTTLTSVPISNVKSIHCGGSHTIFLLNDGTVKGCGSNGRGQLGLGNNTNQLTPVTIPITNVKHIACGGLYTLFLLNDGTVKACGYNDNGQLGLGDTDDRLDITVIPITNVKQIATGGAHSLFLLNDGTVKGCGLNGSGQLGLGDIYNVLTLTNIPITNVKSIHCSSSHTVFLLEDGTVKVCGFNTYGQLGTGSCASVKEPTIIPISDIRQIEATYSNTYFLLNDGTVKCSGIDQYGLFGVRDLDQTTPLAIMSGVSALNYYNWESYTYEYVESDILPTECRLVDKIFHKNELETNIVLRRFKKMKSTYIEFTFDGTWFDDIIQFNELHDGGYSGPIQSPNILLGNVVKAYVNGVYFRSFYIDDYYNSNLRMNSNVDDYSLKGGGDHDYTLPEGPKTIRLEYINNNEAKMNCLSSKQLSYSGGTLAFISNNIKDIKPDTGWSRFYCGNTHIKFIGDDWEFYGFYANYYAPKYYNNEYKCSNSKDSYIEFSFTGPQIRILGPKESDLTNNVIIELDHVKYNFSQNSNTKEVRAVLFEKLNLANTVHHVKIYKGGNDDLFYALTNIELKANEKVYTTTHTIDNIQSNVLIGFKPVKNIVREPIYTIDIKHYII